ncbi:SIS domain-containing protein, partial [Patescibacteria group bacterium]|nr:SIS domain-containing protein [Patescibacteria group bacterium]
AWDETKKIKLPKSFKNIENVVIAGMGGSSIGPHFVKSVFNDNIKVPVEIVNDYVLPSYAAKKTLVLLSSYSGNTAEVLSCARQAKARGARVLVLTSGGKLARLAEKNKWPAYIFKPKWNPCAQPRVGSGYMIFGSLGLLARAGLAKARDAEIKDMLATLEKQAKRFGSLNKKNPAKDLARQLKNKMVFIVVSGFLQGNAHIFANQLNETAKQFAAYFVLPEINHHLLEGLTFPKGPKKDMVFLFFESGQYHAQTQKRYALTRQIIKQNKIKTITYKLNSDNKLAQAAEMLMLGAYASFYLAMLNAQDPALIPWVDYLKKRLR